MSAAPAMVSIGDDGVLNREVSQPLSDIWLDRDLGWLDFRTEERGIGNPRGAGNREFCSPGCFSWRRE